MYYLFKNNLKTFQFIIIKKGTVQKSIKWTIKFFKKYKSLSLNTNLCGKALLSFNK